MNRISNQWLIMFVLALAVMAVLVSFSAIGSGNVGVIHLNDSILASDLNSTNAQTDNYVATYDAASGGFTWVANNDSILAADLNSTNAATDNYVATYDLGSGGFTWESNSVGGAAALADDSVWVGDSGGTAAAQAIPDCDANILARLQYDVTTNSLTCEQATDLVLPGDLTLTEGWLDIEPNVGADTAVRIYSTAEYDPYIGYIEDGTWKFWHGYDASSDVFIWYNEVTGEDSATIDEVANQWEFYNPIEVGSGGTGVSSLTDHGVLIGSGVGDVSVTAVGTTGQVLTGVTGGDPVWAAAGGGGGITNADQWRLHTAFAGGASPIASNLERVDTDGFGQLGSGMSESSGIFTFPTTGIWLVSFDVEWYSNAAGAILDVNARITTTTDDSSYDAAAQNNSSTHASSGFDGCSTQFIFDVTSTTTHKVRFDIATGGNPTILGSTTLIRTGMTFIRLGDT